MAHLLTRALSLAGVLAVASLSVTTATRACLDYGTTLHWIGFISDRGTTSVVIANDRAFVGDEVSGIAIYDFTNPFLPFEVDEIAFSYKMNAGLIADDYLFVTGTAIVPGSGFGVIDLSPGAGYAIVQTSIAGEARNLAKSGDYVYVAAGTAGLVAIDVSNPDVPAVVTTLTGVGEVHDVVLSGTLLYLADYEGAFHVVDIQTPSAPVLIGTYETPNRVRAVTSLGSVAYLAAGSAGPHDEFYVIDVSVPSIPTLLVSLDLPSFGEDLKVAGDGSNRVFVATRNDGLHLFDVSTPASPSLLGTISNPATPSSIEVSSTLALVSSSAGLQIIDAEQSAGVGQMGSASSSYELTRIDYEDNHVFLATTDRHLTIFDVTVPAAPVETATLDFTSGLRDLVVEDGIAYVIGNGVSIIDVDDPAAPVQIGYSPNGYLAIDKQDDYIYATGGVLDIIDISDPTTPALVSFYDPLPLVSHGWDLDVQGDFAYTLFTNSLEKVDISDKLSPTLVAQWTVPEPAGQAIAVHGNYAYVLGSKTEFYVLDVSANPIQLVSTFDIPSPHGERIDIQGDYAYVSGGVVGVHVFDISDPLDVQPLGGAVPGGTTMDTVENAGTLYVAAYDRLVIVPAQCEFASEAPAPPSQRWSTMGVRPNPSSGHIQLRLDLPNRTALAVDVLSADGRRVRRIFEGEASGTFQPEWDGRDDAAEAVPSGVYWIRARSEMRTWNGRVSIVR